MVILLLMLLDTIFVGYSTGMLRNFDRENNKLFEIPTHRGNVNSLYVDGNYILTGGEDGVLRVWTRSTHELIIQMSAHHSNLRKLLCDQRYPNVIYTCGDDRKLNSFDIKQQNEIILHSIKNGTLRSLDQVKETSDISKKIIFYSNFSYSWI